MKRAILVVASLISISASSTYALQGLRLVRSVPTGILRPQTPIVVNGNFVLSARAGRVMVIREDGVVIAGSVEAEETYQPFALTDGRFVYVIGNSAGRVKHWLIRDSNGVLVAKVPFSGTYSHTNYQITQLKDGRLMTAGDRVYFLDPKTLKTSQSEVITSWSSSAPVELTNGKIAAAGKDFLFFFDTHGKGQFVYKMGVGDYWGNILALRDGGVAFQTSDGVFHIVNGNGSLRVKIPLAVPKLREGTEPAPIQLDNGIIVLCSRSDNVYFISPSGKVLSQSPASFFYDHLTADQLVDGPVIVGTNNSMNGLMFFDRNGKYFGSFSDIEDCAFNTYSPMVKLANGTFAVGCASSLAGNTPHPVYVLNSKGVVVGKYKTHFKNPFFEGGAVTPNGVFAFPSHGDGFLHIFRTELSARH